MNKKFGIKMSDCKFYVDEKNRVVVCVYEDTSRMLIDFINSKLRLKNLDVFYAVSDFDEFKMPKSFSGKAVCAPEDEWNEELGRKIAYARMRSKCYKSFFRRANRIVRMVDSGLSEIIDVFNKFGDSLNEKGEALDAEINTLMNGEK